MRPAGDPAAHVVLRLVGCGRGRRGSAPSIRPPVASSRLSIVAHAAVHPVGVVVERVVAAPSPGVVVHPCPGAAPAAARAPAVLSEARRALERLAAARLVLVVGIVLLVLHPQPLSFVHEWAFLFLTQHPAERIREYNEICESSAVSADGKRLQDERCLGAKQRRKYPFKAKVTEKTSRPSPACLRLIIRTSLNGRYGAVPCANGTVTEPNYYLQGQDGGPIAAEKKHRKTLLLWRGGFTTENGVRNDFKGQLLDSRCGVPTSFWSTRNKLCPIRAQLCQLVAL